VIVQLLDVEWLLSTLFDASLLSPSSRRQRRLLFCRLRCARRGLRLSAWFPCGICRTSPGTGKRGNYVRSCCHGVLDRKAQRAIIKLSVVW